MANRVVCGYFLFDVRCADKRNCHVLSFMFRPRHPSKQEGPQPQPLENPQILTQIPPSSATNACTPQSSQPNTLHSTTIPAMQQPTTNAIKSNLNPHLEDPSHQTHWESPRTATWSSQKSSTVANGSPLATHGTTAKWKLRIWIHLSPLCCNS